MAIIALGPLLVIIYAYSRAQYSAAQAYDELERLCNLDAGTTVDKTVNATGYFDAGGYFKGDGNCISCWKNLISTDYQFIEFCDDSPFDSDAINEPGCWRVYKADKNSSNCDSRLSARLNKGTIDPPVAEFLATQCLATKKLEQPTAAVGVFRETTHWTIDNYHKSELSKHREYVALLASNEVLGEHLTYKALFIPDSSARTTQNCLATATQTPYIPDIISKAIVP